jgi:predicted nucleotidyltransferase
MKMRFIDLSNKVEAFIVEALESILKVAEALDIPFFVVGATARDVILVYAFGIKPTRATKDVDIGVQVKDWRQFNRLSEELLGSRQFTKGKSAQRFYYKGKLRIDIVPFGGIDEPHHEISWPPEHEFEMSTLGFAESYESAVTIKLRKDPILEVKFATPCGLAALKIISWNDRKAERERDAQDLELIMRNYVDAGNFDRVFESEVDLLDMVNFEYVGARLLGRDLAVFLNQTTKDKILLILDQETGEQERYRFIEAMMAGRLSRKDNFEDLLTLLEELKTGLKKG